MSEASAGAPNPDALPEECAADSSLGLECAQAAKVRLLALQPGVTIAAIRAMQLSDEPLYWQQFDAHIGAGLRKAGISEKQAGRGSGTSWRGLRVGPPGRRRRPRYHLHMQATDRQTRRRLLARGAGIAAALAGAGLLPRQAQAAWSQAAFDGKSLPEVMKALDAALPVESKEVLLTGPEIAENGAVVPVVASATATGVKRIVLMVEKNPTMLAAVFEVTDAIEPSFSTRIKMAQSSLVYAAAITGDGRVLYAQKDIKVTLGGCGG